eukprot:3935323-Rhodomonas_salina.2
MVKHQQRNMTDGRPWPLAGPRALGLRPSLLLGAPDRRAAIKRWIRPDLLEHVPKRSLCVQNLGLGLEQGPACLRDPGLWPGPGRLGLPGICRGVGQSCNEI